MLKLLTREIGYVLLTGLFAMLFFPVLLSHGADAQLFAPGFLMALTFAALYAMLLMGAERTPLRWRPLVAVVAWALAFTFGGERFLLGATGFDWRVLYVNGAPPLFGLVVMVVAAVRSEPAKRLNAAFTALMAYAVPMAGVRWLLAPLVSANPVIQLLALQSGAFYMFLRVLGRTMWPSAIEGGGGALTHRAVPDAIAGLVEGTTRRRARPYVTLQQGVVDETAISVLCRPQEAGAVAERLHKALEGKPFAVAEGPLDGDQAQIVIRAQQP